MFELALVDEPPKRDFIGRPGQCVGGVVEQRDADRVEGARHGVTWVNHKYEPCQIHCEPKPAQISNSYRAETDDEFMARIQPSTAATPEAAEADPAKMTDEEYRAAWDIKKAA